MDMAVKHGGKEVVNAIDSLEPNAWKHESVKMAAEALLEIKSKGYMLEGTEGLDHIQSQTRWNEGKAAFIPSGSWLENEQKKVAPEGFATTVAPTPLLDGAKLPFQCTRVSAAEAFIVPAKAKNVPGGLEYLRIMLSKEGASKFTELTAAPTVVQRRRRGPRPHPGRGVGQRARQGRRRQQLELLLLRLVLADGAQDRDGRSVSWRPAASRPTSSAPPARRRPTRPPRTRRPRSARAASRGAGRPARRRSAMRHGQTRFIVGFLVLPLALYAVFVISPFVQAFYYSLTNWTGVSPTFDFVGLQNFQTLLRRLAVPAGAAEQRGPAGGDAAGGDPAGPVLRLPAERGRGGSRRRRPGRAGVGLLQAGLLPAAGAVGPGHRGDLGRHPRPDPDRPGQHRDARHRAGDPGLAGRPQPGPVLRAVGPGLGQRRVLPGAVQRRDVLDPAGTSSRRR